MRKQFIPVALVLLVLIGFGVRTSAQGTSPLAAIQATLDTLVESVNAIGGAVKPGNVLTTATLLRVTGGGQFLCTARNVSADERNVTLVIYNTSSNIPFQTQTGNVPPGFSLLALSAPAAAQLGACTITVNNGTTSDIRGDLMVADFNTGGVTVVEAK